MERRRRLARPSSWSDHDGRHDDHEGVEAPVVHQVAHGGPSVGRRGCASRYSAGRSARRAVGQRDLARLHADPRRARRGQREDAEIALPLTVKTSNAAASDGAGVAAGAGRAPRSRRAARQRRPGATRSPMSTTARRGSAVSRSTARVAGRRRPRSRPTVVAVRDGERRRHRPAAAAGSPERDAGAGARPRVAETSAVTVAPVRLQPEDLGGSIRERPPPSVGPPGCHDPARRREDADPAASARQPVATSGAPVGRDRHRVERRDAAARATPARARRPRPAATTSESSSARGQDPCRPTTASALRRAAPPRSARASGRAAKRPGRKTGLQDAPPSLLRDSGEKRSRPLGSTPTSDRAARDAGHDATVVGRPRRCDERTSATIPAPRGGAARRCCSGPRAGPWAAIDPGAAGRGDAALAAGAPGRRRAAPAGSADGQATEQTTHQPRRCSGHRTHAASRLDRRDRAPAPHEPRTWSIRLRRSDENDEAKRLRRTGVVDRARRARDLRGRSRTARSLCATMAPSATVLHRARRRSSRRAGAADSEPVRKYQLGSWVRPSWRSKALVNDGGAVDRVGHDGDEVDAAPPWPRAAGRSWRNSCAISGQSVVQTGSRKVSATDVARAGWPGSPGGRAGRSARRAAPASRGCWACRRAPRSGSGRRSG